MLCRLFLLKFFCLLLRLFFTLFSSAFAACLLLLLAIVVFHYRTRVNHHRVNRRTTATTSGCINVLINELQIRMPIKMICSTTETMIARFNLAFSSVAFDTIGSQTF
ncbi:Uncharacterised protein [Cedecea neteri]|uniref:Uncharacterized protein n=1 Tax=Cedecea neteri TaxID=158822 RepID=A0A2X2V413_9ENTR|nr:Uncharacterised protein [Cedecea neteri]